MIEIMSPAGSWEALQAALKADADSIYFGVDSLHMRARAAKRFTKEDLPEIVKRCRENKVKTYLTVNIVLYDNEIEEMHTLVDAAKEAGVTAIIASDIAAIRYANEKGMEVHISTQCNVSNTEAVKFYAKYADVIVLARELTLEQIKKIIDTIDKENIFGPSGKKIRIELFAHGALCVSISGKCYMSLAQYNHSANRGDCLQACRRKYQVKDEETGDELAIDNHHIMSPKDLCTITFLDQLLDAGVQVLKLEGRGRPAEYVYTVTKAYKEAARSWQEGTFTKEKASTWKKELEKVFNRGFWEGGYYLGKKLGEWSGTYGSKATEEKVQVGKVTNYYSQKQVVEVKVEAQEIKDGDKILITGPTTGVVYGEVTSLRVEEKIVTFSFKEKVRANDAVYLLKPKPLKNA
jgi:putative protease